MGALGKKGIIWIKIEYIGYKLNFLGKKLWKNWKKLEKTRKKLGKTGKNWKNWKKLEKTGKKTLAKINSNAKNSVENVPSTVQRYVPSTAYKNLQVGFLYLYFVEILVHIILTLSVSYSNE